jgi:oxalate decarboxylase
MTHLFKLSAEAPQEKTNAGTRTRAHKANFPLLQGMSLYKLHLEPRGLREPHWHANADELGYCLQGSLLVRLYDTDDKRDAFPVRPGEVFFIPSGALHSIENVGEETAEVLLVFSHEDVEDFNLSSTLGVFSNEVLGNTWGVEASVFDTLKRPGKSVFAALRDGQVTIPEKVSSPYHYSLEAEKPVLANSGGSVHMAKENVWPIAQKLALYSLRLTGSGMREPHWHPETAELGYVAQGRGRMTIYSPSGEVDTYIMEEGDIYFIPKAYPHHIENLEESDLHLLIFFDQGMPRDIGFTGSISSYPAELLIAVTKCDLFRGLPKYEKDLFIVNRIN